MSGLTDEQASRLLKLSRRTNKDILGLCTFCQCPLSREAAKRAAINFNFTPQTLMIHFDGQTIPQEINGFYICGTCLADPFKVNIMQQIARIDIDLNHLNNMVAQHLKQKEIKQKHIDELNKELSSVSENTTDVVGPDNGGSNENGKKKL